MILLATELDGAEVTAQVNHHAGAQIPGQGRAERQRGGRGRQQAWIMMGSHAE